MIIHNKAGFVQNGNRLLLYDEYHIVLLIAIQKWQTEQICCAVSPAFVEWNNAMCYYAHSLQGDIVAWAQ